MTITDPDGRRLAAAKEILLNDIVPGKKPITVVVRDGFVRVERLPNGRLKAFDYAPSRTGPPSTTAYSVDVERMSVLYDDRTTAVSYRKWLSSPLIRVDGVGGRWVSSATLRIDQVGSLAVRMRGTDEGRFDLQGSTNHLEVAKLLRRFVSSPDLQRAPSLRGVTMSRGSVRGHFEVAVVPQSPVVWRSSLVGSLQDFSYGNDVHIANGTVTATLNQQGARGLASVSDAGSHAVFDGTLDWRNGLILGGKLVADAPRARSLPKFLARMVPPDLAFDSARFQGWLDYREPQGVRVSGLVQADQARYAGELVTHPLGRLDFDPREAIIDQVQTGWQSASLTGAFHYDLVHRQLVGHVRAPQADLARLSRRFGLSAIEGKADVDLVITGTAASPKILARASGTATSHEQGYTVRLGRLELAAHYQDKNLGIDRLTVVGPSGTMSANGYWSSKQDKIDVNLLATSVPLGAFLDSVDGSGAFAGKIVGTAHAPRAEGQIEVFNAQVAGQDLPFLRGDVVIDRDGLTADNVLAFKSGARAFGQGHVRFRDKLLERTFDATGINLKNYPPQELSGIARVRSGQISGTLDNPAFSALVEAENVVATNFSLDQVEAQVVLKDRSLLVQSAHGTAGSGSLNGSGAFSLESKTGTFDLTAQNMPLQKLLQSYAEGASIEGLLDGKVSGAFENAAFKSLVADGDVKALRVNDAFLGNGPITLNLKDHVWDGTAFLGDLNAFLEVPTLKFDDRTRMVSGDLTANNFDLKLIYNGLERYLADDAGNSRIPDSVRAKLDTVGGNIDLNAHAEGALDKLAINVQQLDFQSLVVDGQSAGTLSTKFARNDKTWTINGFDWKGGPAVVKINRGTITENGPIDIDGEIRDLDWKWLSIFQPQLAHIQGRTDLPFLVSGLSSSPEIQASLSYDESQPAQVLTPFPGTRVTLKDPRVKTRRIDLESLLVKEGLISAAGVYNVEGFTGTIDASIPFRYPFEIPQDQPLSAKIDLPPRPLGSLTEFFPWLDTKRTDGDMSASLVLSGTPGDIHILGSTDLNAKSLAASNVATALQMVKLNGRFDGTKVSINGEATGSEGGSIQIDNVGLSFDNLSDIIGKSFDEIYRNQLFGSLKLNDLKATYMDPKEGPLTATLSGHVGVEGELATPKIGGELILSQANVAAPTLSPTTTGALGGPINPFFDVNILTADNIKLRGGSGKFELTGAGHLGGSLFNPDFVSKLSVEKGSIRLPNARITIEQGGEINVTYRSSPTGLSAARADLNLTGRTQVSAQGITGSVERYDVVLTIRGDLLADNGLQLSAQSDPPDLSQDRIMAILGQGDVLASRPGESFRADRQIQSALYGIAIPYLAGGFTEQIATQLGLDYLNVEYNAFDQFTVTAAISLGRDFVLSGRRQISPPANGQRTKFDFRISYRPPFKNKVLRRFSLSAGVDQDRPWKISLEYGIRF